LKLKFTDFGF